MHKQRLLKLQGLTIKPQIAIHGYVHYFCEKQELKFEGWVANQLGSVGWFNDYAFDFLDVVYDVDNEIEKGLIVKYDDYVVATGNMVSYRDFCESRPDLNGAEPKEEYMEDEAQEYVYLEYIGEPYSIEGILSFDKGYRSPMRKEIWELHKETMKTHWRVVEDMANDNLSLSETITCPSCEGQFAIHSEYMGIVTCCYCGTYIEGAPNINYGTITFMHRNDEGEVTPHTWNIARYIVKTKDYIEIVDDYANIWKLYNIFDTWYEVDEPREVLYSNDGQTASLYGRCEIMIIKKNVGCVLYASSLTNIK